jgi:hypothetical protein
MPEKENNKITQPQVQQPQQGDAVEQRSGALTGSGALHLVAEVVENPTVAATIGASVGATVTHLLHRPKEPPPPPEPPHSGLWVPSSADD